MVSVELPRALSQYAGGQTRLSLEGPCATVGDALNALRERAGGVVDRVLTERGEVRPHVNVFVGSESIRFMQGLHTPLTPGARILIVAAVSGG
jgi:molybdopterin converting factor small subunit